MVEKKKRKDKFKSWLIFHVNHFYNHKFFGEID